MWQIMRYQSGVNVWVKFNPPHATRDLARKAIHGFKRKYASSRFRVEKA